MVELAILAGSLAAVLALAALTRLLGLGVQRPIIRDAGHAIVLAEEAETGFGGVRAEVDAAGTGAIVTNANGAMMLVRAHGVHFAARRIRRNCAARLNRRFLTINPGDRHFGAVTLDLGDRAGSVAASLRGLV